MMMSYCINVFGFILKRTSDVTMRGIQNVLIISFQLVVDRQLIFDLYDIRLTFQGHINKWSANQRRIFENVYHVSF